MLHQFPSLTPLLVLLLALTGPAASAAPEATTTTEASAEDVFSDGLQRFARAHGYQAIELERMATGHLLLEVSINDDTPRRFVCDTGSNATVVFPALAKELGLASQALETTAGGLGGAEMELRLTVADSMTISGVRFEEPELLVLDLSSINMQFESVGERPIEGILGADWLDLHEAVIHLPSNRLFVRP
ncbi:MAG: retropepsin-like aspartic protease [Acidobacteriota bacterium]